MVTGLVVEGNRVTGVDYRRPGRGTTRVRGRARSSSAAARSTRPQLLLLSGIGPKADLEQLGIPVVADLPGVGSNLQDHLEVYIQYASKQPVSIGPWLKHRHKPRIGAEWLFLRSGVGATNHFEAGGFIRSNDRVDYPNLMFHFLPIAIRYDGSQPAAEHGYQVHIGPMYSDVRGTITLKSTRPATSTRRCGSTTCRPRTTAASGSRWSAPPGTSSTSRRSRRSTPARSRPGPSVETDQEILDWVAKDAETALHPSCTARMGVDDQSVLDPRDDARARRRGAARRRRLLDALHHQRQHLRAGDDARREGRRPDPRATRPLPPSDAPFYRYREDSPLHPPGRPPMTHDREQPMTQPARRPTQRVGDCRPVGRRTSGRSSAPRPTRSSARPTPTCPRKELQEKTGCVAGGQGRLVRRARPARCSW